MIVINTGHFYILESYDTTPKDKLVKLQFMKRIGEKYPGNIGEPLPGTNCQEVIRVLIDRIHYLNNQIPHSNNEEIISYLRSSLWLLEDRAAQRHKRNLHASPNGIEKIPTCKICGHIECKHLKAEEKNASSPARELD